LNFHFGNLGKLYHNLELKHQNMQNPKESDSPLQHDRMALAAPVDEDVIVAAPENEGFLKAARSKALRPFIIISSSYLLFTITDGAIRMIVLLHAYNKSFSALEVSIMFTLYELAGVFTNLAAGFMGARWGIKYTLITGLSFQLLSYGLLFGWIDEWPKLTALIYVTSKSENCCTWLRCYSNAKLMPLLMILVKSCTNVCWYRKGSY
jgi:Na+/melibiose symporter-like transporter